MAKPKIYSTPTCPYCHYAKRWFRDNNIEFEEFDVSVDEKARSRMLESTGETGVPQIEIGDTWIIGFDPEALAKELKKKKE